MDAKLAIHGLLLVFFAIIFIYTIKVFIANIKASKKNAPVDNDLKNVSARLKKMLPFAIIAFLIIAALNVLPIIFLR